MLGASGEEKLALFLAYAQHEKAAGGSTAAGGFPFNSPLRCPLDSPVTLHWDSERSIMKQSFYRLTDRSRTNALPEFSVRLPID
jgi:hypothetical protein